jgi:hypothetical protein
MDVSWENAGNSATTAIAADPSPGKRVAADSATHRPSRVVTELSRAECTRETTKVDGQPERATIFRGCLDDVCARFPSLIDEAIQP